METRVGLEQQRVREIAREYRDKGYEVVIQPGRGQLPDFLANYSPDVLARGEDENLIVEVGSKTSLPGSRDLQELAKVIQEHPGWRLELVVTNPKEGALYAEDAPSLNKRGIAEATEKVRELLGSNHLEAALLLAWATIEATLRLLAKEEEVPLQRGDAAYLLKQLATYAAISADEYNRLMGAMRSRNAVAHGFEVEELDSSSVQELLSILDRLLQLASNE